MIKNLKTRNVELFVTTHTEAQHTLVFLIPFIENYFLLL